MCWLNLIVCAHPRRRRRQLGNDDYHSAASSMSFRTKEMLLSAILCILTSWKRPVTTTGFDHDDCVIQDETHFGCSHSPRGNGSMPFGRVQKTNQFSFIVVITFTRTFADRICGRRQGHPTFALPVIRKKFHFFLFLKSGNMDQTTLFGLVTLK